MSFSQALDAAAGATTCNMLDAAGASLVGYGAVSLAAGGAGAVPLTAGAIALLTKNLLCDPGWDPNKQPAGDGIFSQGRCTHVTGGGGTPQVTYNGVDWSNLVGFNLCGYVYYEEKLIRKTSDTHALFSQSWTTTGGEQQYQEVEGQIRKTRLNPCVGATCDGTGDITFTPPPPYEYTDPTTSCTYIVSLQDFVSLPDTSVQPVYKISPGPQSRTGGGIIGGCNFDPVIYVSGPPGQPPYVGPWDPTWPDGPSGGTPPWLDFVNDLIGGLVSNVVANELAKLFETPYPEGSRTIRAACNYKEDGTPETFTVVYPEQTWQSRVLTALDAITEFQQQTLLWKTPICSCGNKPLTGAAVTINWVSDEYSPNGNDRLRKLFHYFDQAGSTLEQTVAHWQDFSWDAGPVIVSCCDTPLGKPQVWASSEAEARRVINHAAAIAGVDLKDAEWQVTSPKSARYGGSGRMRVHRSQNGTLGITKRDGPSGSPMGLS